MANIKTIYGQTKPLDNGEEASRLLSKDGAVIICGQSKIMQETNSYNVVEACEDGGLMKYTAGEFIQASTIVTNASLQNTGSDINLTNPGRWQSPVLAQ